MDGKSLTPPAVKLNQLKQIFPEVFTENNIDWEKLRITLGENINFANERYVLNWPEKRCFPTDATTHHSNTYADT